MEAFKQPSMDVYLERSAALLANIVYIAVCLLFVLYLSCHTV